MPLARGDGLVSSGGHVGEHLAQVRAALFTAHMLVDDLAPAWAHGAANEFVHAVRCARAFGVRNTVHRGGDVLNHQAAVQGDPDFQAVNGFIGWEKPLVGHFEIEGLDVGQFGFNVPQAIFAVVTLVDHGSRM